MIWSVAGLVGGWLRGQPPHYLGRAHADRRHYGERLSACDSGHPSSSVIEARRRIDIAVTVDVTASS
jgi:hypothetical protein